MADLIDHLDVAAPASPAAADAPPPRLGDPPPGPPLDWANLGLSLLAFVLALANLFWLGIMVYQMPKNDFGRSFLSAASFADGGGLYDLNPSVPWDVHGEMLYLWNLNPPHFHLLMLPLVWLPQRVALVLWLIGNFVCLYAALRVIAAEAQLQLTPRQRRLAVVGFLAFIGTATAMATGHLSFLLFLLVTLSWRDARRGRWGRSGLWLGLALSVKPFLLFLVPYLLWRRRWRAVGAIGASVVACFAVGLLVFGVQAHLDWKARLSVVENWAFMPMNASAFGALSRSLTANAVFTPIAVVPNGPIVVVWLAVAVPAALLTYAACAGETTARGVDRAFALMLAAALLVSPLGWTYYFWLPLGPAALLARDWWCRRSASPLSRRLLLASLPGFLFPLFFIDLGQPSAVSTVTLGNAFFWGLLLFWLALTVDGLRAWFRPAPVSEGGAR
jgi:hypothetical protein